jgi:hypothetical protein
VLGAFIGELLVEGGQVSGQLASLTVGGRRCLVPRTLVVSSIKTSAADRRPTLAATHEKYTVTEKYRLLNVVSHEK